MKIGFFTDTYFPQVSGVSTSIKILKQELEKLGHDVYIFTTTDPDAKEVEPRIIRMPSIPFISFKDRRVVIRGMLYAYHVAKEIDLDIVHTHTEFGVGILGKQTAKALDVPVVHTYHTMYEDYLHYIAKGKVLKPVHVKQLSKLYTNHMSGIICPSQRVVNKLKEYGIERPMSVIPTGIDVSQFKPVEEKLIESIRETYKIDNDACLLLSVSRISYEKNIQTLLKGMPKVVKEIPNVKLLIVGDGPFKAKLEKQVDELGLLEQVIFTGEIPNKDIAPFYQAADYFVSASDSETQGLTYTEAMAAKTKVVAKGNDYLDNLFDDESLGVTYDENEEFSQTLIDYIKKDISIKQSILENKLYDISSEAFGKRVEEFYQKALVYFEENHQEYEDDSNLYSLKLFRK
ncbi:MULTISPECIES: glycosyltransferase family 4 protein [unclassified Vagococcus]|uniref:glycosyltransferase family 4 protein n=1 Tax=unclassified Vagococcus TaxID=2648499 RepID=UPI001F513C52|nr:glycosyltransferase family 4 protein [Vagococcus sp. CY52-2]MCI0130227.1 glycosyltransferase family 4 protein [Vagococcus sp. CY53-2]UNM89049.1 glycosyltransferase family 4 protein [Vagococcus sp. CY52-2]